MRLFLLFFCFSLLSCTRQNKKSFFYPNALPTQRFTINPAKDTILKTAGGALLQIERGSFSGGDAPLTIEVKEALTMQDIVLAGLTTRSNEGLLSSGGMMYINTSDETIRIRKPLKISLPTASFASGMKLYKGEEGGTEINWVDPGPLLDTVPERINRGRAIFAGNCATCHALDKQLTGPALRGVEKRGPWTERQNLVDWVHNPGAFIPLTQYTTCLIQTYNGQIMPSFPQLSGEDLNNVFDYIKWNEANESSPADPCADSCRRYDSALLVANRQKLLRTSLVKDNGPMSEVIYNNTSAGIPTSSGNFPDTIVTNRDVVTIEDNRAEYYRFSINAFGWYNVDMLLKERDDLQESKLTVTLQGPVKQHVDIYLVVPVVKLFAKAGRTNNPDEFAFDTKDGKLPLPHNVSAYVLAVSETEKGVLFQFREFTTSHTQEIPIEVKPSSKEEIYGLFQSLKLEDVSIEIAKARNADEIRKIDKAAKDLQKEAEKLKPGNCTCSCAPPSRESADTLPKLRPAIVAPGP